jgi:hypothetical protein
MKKSSRCTKKMNWIELKKYITMKTMKANKSKLGRKGRVMLSLVIAIGIYFIIWAIIGLLIM